jgi:hypothetical protein
MILELSFLSRIKYRVNFGGNPGLEKTGFRRVEYRTVFSSPE